MTALPTEQKESILIGVDFGTTFSGVAYCFTGTPDKTKIVKSWPNNNKNLEKVPSVLQYGSRASRFKWGFEVTPESQSPLKWFKLLLNQHSGTNVSGPHPPPPRLSEAYTNDNAQLEGLFSTLSLLPEEKTPLDLVTDYLSGLYRHTRDTLNKEYTTNFSNRIGKEIPIQFVLTVPAVWSDIAKQQTLQAARAAGMDENHTTIKIVTEPEAAAIYCLNEFKETDDSLKVGDVYVIADCGGGTVDLISYEIVSVQPRLRVKECAVGTGGLCGSTELNRRFEALVKSKIGESDYAGMSNIGRSNAMLHFDEFLKPTFCPQEPRVDDDDEFDDIETYHCPLPGITDNMAKGVYSGHLVLNPEEMKGIFEPTFDKITKLVQEQVSAAEAKSKKGVTGVLLVGGFGSSAYLYQYLEARVKDSDGKPVKILQPREAWTSIVRGAVLYGLSFNKGSIGADRAPAVDSRLARFSYGVSAAVPFIPGIHPASKMVFDRYSGEFMCPGRMSWFVTQGEEIPNDRPIDVDFFRRCPVGAERDELVFPVEILCSNEPYPPRDDSHPGVYHLLVFTADLGDVPRKKYFTRKRAVRGNDAYWEIPFSMLMKYQNKLEFSLEIGGKTLGQGSVLYTHELLKEKPKKQCRHRSLEIDSDPGEGPSSGL